VGDDVTTNEGSVGDGVTTTGAFVGDFVIVAVDFQFELGLLVGAFPDSKPHSESDPLIFDFWHIFK